MATLLSSIVEADPGFVTGTYDAKDVRMATLFNTLPGLYAAGDFAFSQRAAGANMSLDMAQGRAVIDPGGTHQGLYLARRTNATAWNSSVDGGVTVTAADATNPRIDVWGLQLYDNVEDASGVTGWKVAVQVGTPNASAAHQLMQLYWPSLPTGFLPLAAVRVPAAATTLTTANITNLNPIAGGRMASKFVSTTETTAAVSYARLATPDFVFAYVPAQAIARYTYTSQWAMDIAAGTQLAALYIGSNQLKYGAQGGAPVVATSPAIGIGPFYSRLATSPNAVGGAGGFGLLTVAGAGANVTDVTTGQYILGASGTANPSGSLEIFGLPAGWYVFEMFYQTSVNTLYVQNRKSWLQVCG